MLLAASRRGHCGFTTETGTADPRCCEDSGALAIPDSIVGGPEATLDWCVEHCRRVCVRCRHVSVSHTQRECSWYAHCDHNRLERLPAALLPTPFPV